MSVINREILLAALEGVAPGLAAEDKIEQSACYAFQDGEVITFNDEVSCRSPSGLDKSFKGVLHAKEVLELLRKLPDDEIGLEVKEDKLLIIGKGKRTTLPLEKEIHLQVDVVEKPSEWKKLHDDFAEAVRTVAQCAGRNAAEFMYTCVHITPKWVEAADRGSGQICRWRLKTGITQSTLVRQSSIKHVTSLGMVEFSETENWIHFRNTNKLMFSCRRFFETEYPDFVDLLNTEGGMATALPPALAEVAERAAIFSAENTDANQLIIELAPGKIRVIGRGVRGEHREWKKIKYEGESMIFLTTPQLLTDLVKKHNQCMIAPERLKVASGRYVYVACLMKPESLNGKEEE